MLVVESPDPGVRHQVKDGVGTWDVSVFQHLQASQAQGFLSGRQAAALAVPSFVFDREAYSSPQT